MNFLLVRHGETDWNAEGKIQGSRDIPLNAKGLAQASQLAQDILRSRPALKKLYSSTKQRAIQTARILGEATSIEPIIISGVEEVHFGAWEGLSWQEVQERYPDAYQEWFGKRRHTCPPGGESYQQVLERVLGAMRAIPVVDDGDVVLVTHGGVILTLLSYVNGTPFEAMSQYKSQNAGMVPIGREALLGC